MEADGGTGHLCMAWEITLERSSQGVFLKKIINNNNIILIIILVQ